MGGEMRTASNKFVRREIGCGAMALFFLLGVFPPVSHHFSKSHIILAVVGSVVAVSVLAYLASSVRGMVLLGSFGASALLIFALPEAPLSQPRAVFVGHLSASCIAFACFWLWGPQWWAVGLATGLGIGFMMLTRCVHPPAGSNAIIVFLAKPGGWFLISSTVASVAALIAFAWFYHRATGRCRYPVYWRRATAS